MKSSFLKARSSCDNCPLDIQVKNGKFKRDSLRNSSIVLTDLETISDVNVLFLTDVVEKEDDLLKFERLIKKLGIDRYVITSAIGCRTANYKLPSPTYSTMIYCKSFNVDKYNPRVVVSLGRSYNYFTRGAVFDTYDEFKEYIFNDTYFYPHIKSIWKGRIYPAGFLSKIFDVTSFDYFFFKKQVAFVRDHLSNYDKERFILSDIDVVRVDNIDLFLQENADKKEVALDTETSSLNMFDDDFKVGCIQASFDGITGYVLPFDSIQNKRVFSSWLKDKYQIWANGKYDCKCLNRVRVSGARVDEDIPLIFHLLNTVRTSNSIKVLAWLIGFGGYEDELVEYIHTYRVSSYLDIPKPLLYKYAGMDAIVTYRLYQYLKNTLAPRQQETYNLYREAVIPVIPVFQSIEEEGILVDTDYVGKYHLDILERLSQIEDKIYDLLGKKINIGSNDELGAALEEVGLPDHGRTIKGFYKTGKEILVQWKKEGFEISSSLLEYRRLAKLDSTFVGDIPSTEEKSSFIKGYCEKENDSSGIKNYISSDGRVHGSIMPALTDSWRSLSFSPNLQNFPKQGEEGKAFRKVFKAPEGFLICEADYSGFQFRLMGIFSEDDNMKKAFIELNDLHSVSGCSIFSQGTDLNYFIEHKHEDPYKTARYNGKQVNLAFAFRQTPYSFQAKIRDTWTPEQIDEYIEKNDLEIIKDYRTGAENKFITVATDINDRYFKTYPKLKEYSDYRISLACEQGWVHCPIFPGAVRHLPELTGISNKLSKEDSAHYSSLKNLAVNAEAQAGEAINVYKALSKIHDTLKKDNLKSRLIGCVHDSIVAYVHKSEIREMYNLFKTSMERFDYSIPILVDVQMGDIWGFGEDINSNNIDEFIKANQI